jgi:membrane protein implicated in regulation of membrane protease activity
MWAADQPWWCGRLTSALAIHETARRWLAAAFIRLRLDISTPGGHPVNFGLSVLFVVLASAPLGIGAHTVSTALTGSAVLVSCSSLAPSDRFLDPSACDALTGSAVLVS